MFLHVCATSCWPRAATAVARRVCRAAVAATDTCWRTDAMVTWSMHSPRVLLMQTCIYQQNAALNCHYIPRFPTRLTMPQVMACAGVEGRAASACTIAARSAIPGRSRRSPTAARQHWAALSRRAANRAVVAMARPERAQPASSVQGNVLLIGVTGITGR